MEMTAIRMKNSRIMVLAMLMVVSGAAFSQGGDERLIGVAYEVLESIRDRDYISLSRAVHPQKGVTFTAYSYAHDDDICFSADEIKHMTTDTKSYYWGGYDGRGVPIILTFEEYCARFVYDKNYIDVPDVSVNSIMAGGNTIENVREAYPEAQ